MSDSYSLLADLKSFSIGSSGFRFFTEAEFAEGQLGYSRNGGESLAGQDEGDWKSTWQVIGYEEACGDPIFVDTSSEELTVFTAIHGIGEWTPKPIADTLDSFKQSLAVLAEVAIGRENPVRLEANPIDDSLREKTLVRIRTLNPHADLEFWELAMGIY